MNSEFQIIRWGIPGWVFLLTYAFFELSYFRFNIVNFINSVGPAQNITGIAALFAGLGVPLGYLIYQVYFCIKWQFIKNRTDLAMQNIDYFKNVKTGNDHKDWRLVEEHFDYLMSIVVPRKIISTDDIKRRYDYYSSRLSRVHGLGASLIALLSALAIFLSLNLSNVFPSSFVGSLFVYVLISLAILGNYTAQNKNTFILLNSMMIDICRAENKPPEKGGKG